MNTMSDAQTRYTTGAIILHWLMAGLIVVNWLIPILSEGASDAARGSAMGWHTAIGITVLALAVIRIIWRVVHPAPPRSADHAPWERALANFVHTAFYFLIVAIPLAGWIMVSLYSGEGNATQILGIGVPVLPTGKSQDGAGIAHEVHEYLAFAFAALWVLHVAGALKHQFVDKDGTLARMLPFLRR